MRACPASITVYPACFQRQPDHIADDLPGRPPRGLFHFMLTASPRAGSFAGSPIRVRSLPGGPLIPFSYWCLVTTGGQCGEMSGSPELPVRHAGAGEQLPVARRAARRRAVLNGTARFHRSRSASPSRISARGAQRPRRAHDEVVPCDRLDAERARARRRLVAGRRVEHPHTEPPPASLCRNGSGALARVVVDQRDRRHAQRDEVVEDVRRVPVVERGEQRARRAGRAEQHRAAGSRATACVTASTPIRARRSGDARRSGSRRPAGRRRGARARRSATGRPSARSRRSPRRTTVRNAGVTGIM